MSLSLNTSLLVFDPNVVLNFGLFTNRVAIFQHDNNVSCAKNGGVRILQINTNVEVSTYEIKGSSH